MVYDDDDDDQLAGGVADRRVCMSLLFIFKSSKPVQIGLCMQMSLRIHLHSLYVDAQYGQT